MLFVRIAQPQVNPYSQYETYLLIFICIFSGLFALLTLLQARILNPTLIIEQEGKSLVYQVREETEQQINRENINGNRSEISRIQAQIQNNNTQYTSSINRALVDSELRNYK